MFWNRADRHAERIRKAFARCASSFEEEARTAASMAREQMNKHGFSFEDLKREQDAPEREILEKNFRRAQEFWRQQDEWDKAQVLGALGADPVHIDAMAHSLEMDVSRLSGLLLELELLGKIRQHPGKYFSLRVENESNAKDRKAGNQTERPRTSRRKGTQDARDETKGKVWVREYVRRDGRVIRAHWRARRGEAKRKEAWRHDPTASPGEQYQWIASYVRNGNIKVCGYWRKRRSMKRKDTSWTHS